MVQRALCLAFALLAGCDKAPPPLERTEPWLASAAVSSTASAPSPGVPARAFDLDPAVMASFELKGSQAAPRGQLRLGRGRILLDTVALVNTRGTLELDLTSVLMEGTSPGDARQRSEWARSWLGLGSSRPEATRVRLRWATFRLIALEEASAPGVEQGELVRPSASSLEAGAPRVEAGADAAVDAGSEPGVPTEQRRVDFTAVGELTLNARRVTRRVPLRAVFVLPRGRPAEAPLEVRLTTRAPLEVPLALFDIVPRDATGTVLAAEQRRVGTEVGSSARVELDLRLRAAP